MMSLGKTIDELAAEIASSKYFKTIFPGKKEIIQEFNETLNKNQKLKISLKDNEIHDIIQNEIKSTASFLKSNGLSDVDLDEKSIDKLANSMRNTDYSDESFNKLNEALKEKGFEDNAINVTMDEIKKRTSEILSQDITTKDIPDVHKPMYYTKAYFSNPDKSIKNTRINTAIGAYAAINVGGRYLSGGTLTRDEYGRKDIAGIPFL